MKVELLDHNTDTDLAVVNAARVSFDKMSEWDEQFNPLTEEYDPVLSDRDQKLIAFLARENHWSPFAHTYAKFRITAPIFVARQLGKHQVGLVWNEVSRRYVDFTPEFYTPVSWRKRAADKKQGSLDEDTGDWGFGLYNGALSKCLDVYHDMLDYGVCPEQARMILPQSMMTSWIWTGNVMSFARVCNLRLKPDTQAETRLVARYMSDHLSDVFPHSWKALCDVEPTDLPVSV